MRLPILLLSLLSSLLVTSCSGSPLPKTQTAAPNASRMEQGTMNQAVATGETSADVADNSSGGNSSGKSAVPVAKPQLIKKAQLTLVVDKVDQAIQQVITLMRVQQGDVLNLQEQRPTEPGSRQLASLTLRVPQQNLDNTLTELAKLGTVRQQSQTAEDVSSQLVDFKARLRNLRRSEEMLLQIMGRSGSVGDVLKVSQQLSNVREMIEQIDAQLTNLQTQVAYSTITVELEQAGIGVPFQKPVGGILADTWTTATRSMSGFTLGLGKLALWLLAYSPYIALLGGGIYWFRTHRRPRIQPPSTTTESPSDNHTS